MSQSLPTYLDAPVVLELLDNYPTERHEDIRNKAILELLFASGIRVSELINIHLDDIDYLSQECRITGKGDKDRVALFGKRASHAILTVHIFGSAPLATTKNQCFIYF